MNITIQPKDFTAKDGLTDFIREKTEKLFLQYGQIVSCEVVLKIEKADTKENKVCAIRLIIPGNNLLASTQCKTFEEAAMMTIGALEKHIEKRKNKNNIAVKYHIPVYLNKKV